MSATDTCNLEQPGAGTSAPGNDAEAAESGEAPAGSKVFARFCEVSDLPDDSKRAKKINGIMVLVVHTKGKLYAVSNICSHQDKFLHVGRVRNCKITCPLHGAQFDLATGKATCLPATKPIATYDVRVADNWIEVCV